MNGVRGRLRLQPSVIVLLVLVLVVVVGSILVATAGRNFFSQGNVRDILTGMSVLGFVAVGQTLVVLCGSLDLSVPYVVSLASLVAAETMAGEPGNIVWGVTLTLLVAAGVGLVNGGIVTALKVNGFIATLGVGLILSGYLSTQYKGTSGDVPWDFQLVGATVFGPLPLSTIIMLGLVVLVAVFLRRTRTGHHMYAVGGDKEVARLSGLRVWQPVLLAHTLCSMCSALAGLLLASRLGVGSPTVGSQGGYDLLSIAAVVLGGTLLLGGRGSIWGTLGGVAIFAVVDNVMSVLEVNPFLKDVVRGAVIILAVALYTGRRIEARKARFLPGAQPDPGEVPRPEARVGVQR